MGISRDANGYILRSDIEHQKIAKCPPFCWCQKTSHDPYNPLVAPNLSITISDIDAQFDATCHVGSGGIKSARDELLSSFEGEYILEPSCVNLPCCEWSSVSMYPGGKIRNKSYLYNYDCTGYEFYQDYTATLFAAINYDVFGDGLCWYSVDIYIPSMWGLYYLSGVSDYINSITETKVFSLPYESTGTYSFPPPFEGASATATVVPIP